MWLLKDEKIINKKLRKKKNPRNRPHKSPKEYFMKKYLL